MKSEYSHNAYRPEEVKAMVKRAKKLLKGVEFDSFAYSGSSGALMAPVLAYALNKTLLFVRKESDLDLQHHAHQTIEGNDNSEKYIIVDDFISTGNTIDRIVRNLESFTTGEPVGIVLYQHWIKRESWEVNGIELPIYEIFEHEEEGYDG